MGIVELVHHRTGWRPDIAHFSGVCRRLVVNAYEISRRLVRRRWSSVQKSSLSLRGSYV